MSKKRYMPPKGKKQACQPAVSQTASAKACAVTEPRIRIRYGSIWVEGHYSSFGDEYRDGKVFFHHSDHGGCWEEWFTAQDLREIAAAMDKASKEKR